MSDVIETTTTTTVVEEVKEVKGKEETKKPSKVRPEVNELSAKIIKGLKFNKETSSIEETKDNWTLNLPEGITPEIDKKLRDYTDDFIAGSTKAFGELAYSTMSKHPKVEEIDGRISMGGKNYHELCVEKEVAHTNAQGVSSKKYGVITTEYVVKGAESSSLKAVRAELGTLATELLSK